MGVMIGRGSWMMLWSMFDIVWHGVSYWQHNGCSIKVVDEDHLLEIQASKRPVMVNRHGCHGLRIECNMRAKSTVWGSQISDGSNVVKLTRRAAGAQGHRQHLHKLINISSVLGKGGDTEGVFSAVRCNSDLVKKEWERSNSAKLLQRRYLGINGICVVKHQM